MNTHARAPALLDDARAAALFELCPETMGEIVRAVCCAADGEAELGLLATAWKSNPHARADERFSGSAQSDKGNVTGLSISACGGLISVANLTSPIIISLPVSSRQGQTWSMSGTCDAEGAQFATCSPGNNNAPRFNFSCPAPGVEWNTTCRAEPVPTCRFFDEVSGSWSSDGCTTANTSEGLVTCACGHLTDFSGAMNFQLVEGAGVVIGLGDVEAKQLHRNWGVFCLLIGAYLITGVLFWRDHSHLNQRARFHQQVIWSSDAFQASISWLESRRSKRNDEPADSETKHKPWIHDAVERSKQIEMGYKAASSRLRVRLSPPRALSVRDFFNALCREHAALALFTPSHASIERAPVVLLRVIVFAFADAVAYSVFAGQGSLMNPDDAASLFWRLFIVVLQTTVIMVAITPFKILLVSAIRHLEDRDRIHTMIEHKVLTILLSFDDNNRIC